MFVQFIQYSSTTPLRGLVVPKNHSKPASGCSVQYMRVQNSGWMKFMNCLWDLWIISLPGAEMIYFSSPEKLTDLLFKRQQHWGSCSNNSSLLHNNKWRWLLCAIWFWVQSIWNFSCSYLPQNITKHQMKHAKKTCFPFYQFYWLLNRDPDWMLYEGSPHNLLVCHPKNVCLFSFLSWYSVKKVTWNPNIVRFRARFPGV